MSINDMDELFNNSSQMSFLGSSPYTKKFDVSESYSSNPTLRQQPLATEEKQGNASIVEVGDNANTVEEIVEIEDIEDNERKDKSPTQDKADYESQQTSASPTALPPRDYEIHRSCDSKSRYSWRKSLSDYPVVTADICNNLLRCRDELYDIVTDLCDENRRLSDMYNEIRRSPLAEEIKQEYEDVIAEWSEKFNDLQNLYESALQQNQQLQSDLDLERRENDDLRDQLRRIPQLEQDLKSALIRRDVLEKELADTQVELDYLQQDKRKAEALVDTQKKELRSLKIEVNTLRAELNEGVSKPSRPRDQPQPQPQSQESVVLYNRKPALPKREPQNAITATALYDYEGNTDFNSAPMRKGQKMTVLKYKDTRDWVLVQLDNIQTWEPVSYLSIQENTRSSYTRPKSTHISAVTAHAGNKKRALVIADFEGIDPSEMSIHKGEIVHVVKEDNEWLLGSVGARKGWIPVTYVEFI